MTSQKTIVDILRRATTFTKLLPFLLLGGHVVIMLIYWIYGNDIHLYRLIKELLSTSPFVSMLLLVYSKVFHLCKWHKAACLMLSLPTVVEMFNHYVYKFPEGEFEMMLIAIMIACIGSLVSAYFMFIKKRKENMYRGYSIRDSMMEYYSLSKAQKLGVES